MESVALIIGIGTGILSVLTFLGGTYAFIKASSTKRYAAEREIGHLKNSLDQLSTNVNFMIQELDRRFDGVDLRLVEINAYINHKANSNPPKKSHPD